MASYWSQQPNGLYCRWSTCVDALTDWNRDLAQAINMSLGYLPTIPSVPAPSQELLDQRRSTFISRLKPFSRIKEDFYPCTHTLEEFQEILKEMGDKTGLSEQQLKKCREMEEEMKRDEDEEEEEPKRNTDEEKPKRDADKKGKMVREQQHEIISHTSVGNLSSVQTVDLIQELLYRFQGLTEADIVTNTPKTNPTLEFDKCHMDGKEWWTFKFCTKDALKPGTTYNKYGTELEISDRPRV